MEQAAPVWRRILAAQARKIVLHPALVLVGDEIAPDGGKIRAARQQALGFVRRDGLASAVTQINLPLDLGGLPFCLAGADIDQIQLHGADAPVFIDLWGKGDVDGISGEDRCL